MEIVNEVKDFVLTNSHPLAVIVGVAAVAGFLGWGPFKEYVRGLAMKRKRQQEIHDLLTEGYTDVIEQAVLEGKISREEATSEGYVPLKRVYHKCKELSTSEAWLKEQIERRLKNGVHEPVVLPSGKKHNMFTINKAT